MLTGLLTRKVYDQFSLPEEEAYFKKHNLALKLLLLLNSAPGHPHYLKSWHPNVEVGFTSPNNTSVPQPLDQEIIANVKLDFYRRMWAMESALDCDDVGTVNYFVCLC